MILQCDLIASPDLLSKAEHLETPCGAARKCFPKAYRRIPSLVASTNIEIQDPK